ncbi:MAG TPA: hypothetical protein PLZ71_03100, partial [Flavobacterium alvei]|nr:hypothetical protein [Flavobacterium alvei]
IEKLGPYEINNNKLTIKNFDKKSFCEFEDIFPINLGLSKFEVISSLSTLENLKLDEELNRVNSFPRIEKPTYLNGGAVTKITIYYNFTEKENCLNGFKKTLCLDFVDDRLYQIRIAVHYLSTERDKCLENFNILSSIFMQKFPFYNKSILTDVEKNEQIGEGMKFNPTEEKNRDKIKIEKIYLDYQIEYKVEKNTILNEYVKTSNIDEFILNISYLNLKGTKLTNKGF